MNIKNKFQKLIAQRNKKKMLAKKYGAKKSETNFKSTLNAFWSERIALFAALFFFAFGMGLIADGKKIYSHQLKLSQRADYKATNYSTN